jgi:hypothetical protein
VPLFPNDRVQPSRMSSEDVVLEHLAGDPATNLRFEPLSQSFPTVLVPTILLVLAVVEVEVFESCDDHLLPADVDGCKFGRASGRSDLHCSEPINFSIYSLTFSFNPIVNPMPSIEPRSQPEHSCGAASKWAVSIAGLASQVEHPMVINPDGKFTLHSHWGKSGSEVPLESTG